MPREKRNYKANRYYHLYNRGNRKLTVFYDDEDYQTFLNLLYHYSGKYKVSIEAYCLMPNHFHLLVKPLVYGEDISKMMHCTMTGFGIYINNKYHLVGRAFQGTYKHRAIYDAIDLANVKKYFKNNPVEAQMVTKGEYYRWLMVR